MRGLGRALLAEDAGGGLLEVEHVDGLRTQGVDVCGADRDVELGERRCLSTAEGPKAAVCVMEQNVTSWRPSDEGCPQAALAAPRG